MRPPITSSPDESLAADPAEVTADPARRAKCDSAMPTEPETKRIKVFLMPGIFYGRPAYLRSLTASELLNLARFRYALRDHIEFVSIGYPDWREMIANKPYFEAIVTFALDEILAHSNDGVVYLAGYSFGGLVAFATAHRLVQMGHRVAFLGLLDTRLPIKVNASKRIRNSGRHIMRGDTTPLLRLILKILVKFRAYMLLKGYVRFCMSMGSRRIDAELHEVLRSHAASSWRPEALSVPTVFFRTDEDDPCQRDDCGWSALCSSLTVVRIGGSHSSVLKPPNLNRVCASFLQALRANEADSALPAPTGL